MQSTAGPSMREALTDRRYSCKKYVANGEYLLQSVNDFCCEPLQEGGKGTDLMSKNKELFAILFF